jgi:L-ascorbate metabolism protein UlaG (beta-lactamase superfamily)
MKATYFGHSTFYVQLEGAKVLFDPFISPNPAAEQIDIKIIMPDYIALSHAHADHVADLFSIQRQSEATVIAIVETAAWVRNNKVPDEKVIEMNFGGTIQTRFGTAKMVLAVHTNSTPDGGYGGQPVGFVIRSGGKTIYYAGDTALSSDMQFIKAYAPDLVFLPIGGHYTMDVDDALMAAQMIGCKRVVGMHYNTFPPIQIDPNEAQEKFAKAGFELILPQIGQDVNI